MVFEALDLPRDNDMPPHAVDSVTTAPVDIFDEPFAEEELELVASELELTDPIPQSSADIDRVLIKAGIKPPPGQPRAPWIEPVAISAAIAGVALAMGFRFFGGHHRK
jgi:hypothetical protein